MHSGEHFIMEMFKAGAQGYLLKDCAVEELINAIQTVAAKKVYLSARPADIAIKDCV